MGSFAERENLAVGGRYPGWLSNRNRSTSGCIGRRVPCNDHCGAVVDGGTCEKGLNFAPEKVGWEIGWAVSGISQRPIGFLVEKHWLAHGSGYELYEPDVLVVDTLPGLSGLTLAVIVGEIPDAVFHLLVSTLRQILVFEGHAELFGAEMIISAHGSYLSDVGFWGVGINDDC